LSLADAQSMTDIAEMVPSFQREVAVPGTFAQVFPDTTDEDCIGAIADGFAECQLDGFFGTTSLDPATGFITPDVSLAGAAMVIFYAGMRTIRNRIRELRSTKYIAGPTEADSTLAVQALVQELKMLEARKDQLIQTALASSRGATTYVMDSYLARAATYGCFYAWELPASWY
jgi:hypothetical protein